MQVVWAYLSDFVPIPIPSWVFLENFNSWWSPRLPFLISNVAKNSVSWQHYCYQYLPSGISVLTSLSHSQFFPRLSSFPLVKLAMSQVMCTNRLCCSVIGAPIGAHSQILPEENEVCSHPLFPCSSHLWHLKHRALPANTQTLVPAQGRKTVISSALPSGKVWIETYSYIEMSVWCDQLGLNAVTPLRNTLLDSSLCFRLPNITLDSDLILLSEACYSA